MIERIIRAWNTPKLSLTPIDELWIAGSIAVPLIVLLATGMFIYLMVNRRKPPDRGIFQ